MFDFRLLPAASIIHLIIRRKIPDQACRRLPTGLPSFRIFKTKNDALYDLRALRHLIRSQVSSPDPVYSFSMLPGMFF